ncbi:MAG: hypothetical protein LC791_04860 [Acidobacteria bacterium]|nr:hypothetical protein [Acidobacteriota bacterium]
MTFRQAQTSSLDAGASIGPLIRLGSGNGLGVAVGFNWLSVDLGAADAVRLARVRIRPVMAGAGYTWRVERVAASVSLVGGYAFNSLRIDNVAPGSRVVLSVDDSFAWRPGLSVWFEINERWALNGFGGYLVTRPSAMFLDGERLSARTLRADTSLASLGLVYKLF